MEAFILIIMYLGFTDALKSFCLFASRSSIRLLTWIGAFLILIQGAFTLAKNIAS